MSYTYRTLNDESDPARASVRKLVGKAFGGVLGAEYWDWKYRGTARRPLVLVAESADEVVGCRHSLVFDVQLEKGLTVPVVIGGDLLVRPEHRGREVARRLVAESLDLGIRQNPELAAYVSFTWPALAKNLVKPLAGVMPVPGTTRRWAKIVSWDQRIARLIASGFLDEIGPHSGRRSDGHSTLVEIEGAPPLWVEIREGRIEVSATAPSSHQVKVSLGGEGIEALRSRSPGRVLAAVLRGEVKVRGKPRYLGKVLVARRAYVNLLKELLKRPSP